MDADADVSSLDVPYLLFQEGILPLEVKEGKGKE
jgi:hypothetical protein